MVSEVKEEVLTAIVRVAQFFVDNVVLLLIKLTECCWLFCLSLIAVPLRWNLSVVQHLLKQFIKGFCCVGCISVFGLFGIALGFLQGILNWAFGKQEEEPISTSGIQKKEAPISTEEDTNYLVGYVRGLEKKIHAQVQQEKKRKSKKPAEKLLVVLDIDLTLVYSTDQAPSPRESQKYFTYRDSKSGGCLYIYHRPYLHHFMAELEKLSEWIEVATYTAGTKEYADSVL
mmetsp:Transcript_41635/g.63559  ORF Transcript_41635/g.63559 Transcript_41635/m.63559 type:complete len:229 (+) Transcript_41635:644-1330(+)|eukprot:CAMPEP_0170493778 /NCGR_PEP_ID=MMETSP0208-20121228/14261_1 /TAXON_ID=197538 /ORGANISM="Strombidium inclinatum, Strain S3" /LENGTH=228 /DNA_ID=CAMNT_0010769739 /DNA_START=623 /DNA_END=1309 /DNA_ORIENTATION=-